MPNDPLIALVAGETSGDLLGAALIEKLKLQYPNARFIGIGGEQMRGQGFEAWWDCGELAVFGLFEVLSHFSRLLRIRNELRQRLLQLKPDLFIGIDAPDFNLGLETRLKAAGITTIHYVSPTVWAWRPGRVRKIARAVNRVLCLFPFEPDFYRNHGVDAVYVGHPMADQIAGRPDSLAARNSLGIKESGPLLALLPGSRMSEVQRLSAPMLEASALLKRHFPDLQIVAAMANERVEEEFSESLRLSPLSDDITVIRSKAREVIAAADVVLCASGTATLETMLINRPMVMAYKLAPATYHLAKNLRLIRRQLFALPNILARKALIPELIQDEVDGPRLCLEARKWLENPRSVAELQLEFDRLHDELRCDASSRAAVAVSELLTESQ